MNDPMTMTNDEAQEWLLGLLNATPPPRDAARFGAAIRAIRAKAIEDAREWGLAAASEPALDAERLYEAVLPEFRKPGPGNQTVGPSREDMARAAADRIFARLHERTASQEGATE